MLRLLKLYYSVQPSFCLSSSIMWKLRIPSEDVHSYLQCHFQRGREFLAICIIILGDGLYCSLETKLRYIYTYIYH